MDDLAFARAAQLRPIEQVAEQVGIPADALEPYGRHIAKVDVAKLTSGRLGRLVLVSGMSPTPA
ncbi:MAG TPA: formate--tetrahydrofolate ligase, partial [Agromyces sp.]|nr:formate--tetrahydrofolate ligase [Agromyces sp.]